MRVMSSDMQHFYGLENIQYQHTWITIGSFDGVHLGHQMIIKNMVASAHQHQAKAVVITFHPHPAVVLRGLDKPYYLTMPEERAALMAELGVDAVVTLPFTRELAALSAFDFMRNITEKLNPRELWVGSDFALGRNREGNVDHLKEIGEILGFQTRIIQPVMKNGSEKISSSRIRQLLEEGEIEHASRLLGRWYSLESTIIRGDGRGRLLGFPTANLELPLERILPAPGVYATWAWLNGARHQSVTSVGFRPTFTDTPPIPRVEAFIFDFQQDIYGETLSLQFIRRLRFEEKFETIQALIDQMQQDSYQAREVLIHAQPTPGLPA